MTGERGPRLPALGTPADPCPCDACAALAEAIDADLRARLRVLEAAEIVDHRHNLNRVVKTAPPSGDHHRARANRGGPPDSRAAKLPGFLTGRDRP